MKCLMAILLLLASSFLLCSSAEFWWTEWFNPKKSEVPPNELLEFETLFRELDEANPFMEELVEGVLAVPASPVHPIFQKFVLQAKEAENIDLNIPVAPAGEKKISNSLKGCFKGVKKGWGKFHAAINNKAFKMQMHVRGMIEMYTSMKNKCPEQHALFGTMLNDWKKVQLMLKGELEFDGEIVEKFEKIFGTYLHWLAENEEEANRIQPLPAETFVNKWRIVKLAGKLALSSLANNDGQKCGNEKKSGNKENDREREQLFRLLKTLSSEKMRDPTAHRPRRRKRRQIMIGLLSLSAILLTGVAVFTFELVAECCSSSAAVSPAAVEPCVAATVA